MVGANPSSWCLLYGDNIDKLADFIFSFWMKKGFKPYADINTENSPIINYQTGCLCEIQTTAVPSNIYFLC